MKSAAMASFRSAAELPDRDDDEPLTPMRTIPENPASGQRFMEGPTLGRWGVYERVPCECRSCRGTGTIFEKDTGEPDRKCLDCTGTGSSHWQPDLIASDLSEADARLLVFGAQMIHALKMCRAFGSQGDTHEGLSVSEMTRSALENATGEKH